MHDLANPDHASVQGKFWQAVSLRDSHTSCMQDQTCVLLCNCLCVDQDYGIFSPSSSMHQGQTTVIKFEISLQLVRDCIL